MRPGWTYSTKFLSLAKLLTLYIAKSDSKTAKVNPEVVSTLCFEDLAMPGPAAPLILKVEGCSVEGYICNVGKGWP